MKIAIIGSGISGLVCAHRLVDHHQVTIFEAQTRVGGHSNTITVNDPKAGEIGVDTGFIVHNDRNYPNLLKLFHELEVETQASEMSFAVDDLNRNINYRATNLATLFADRKNILKSDMWRMLKDIVAFHKAGNNFLKSDQADSTVTMSDFVKMQGYSQAFTELYLIPLGASIWSADPESFLDFPASSLLSFLSNHGLLGIGNRPNWRTVTGGSRSYVDKLITRFETKGGKLKTGCAVKKIDRSLASSDYNPASVNVVHQGGVETFDIAILACHSDQALKLIEPLPEELSTLSALRYKPNRATLHTDKSVLPQNPKVWASWNYQTQINSDPNSTNSNAILTYDLTRLQRLPGAKRYLVTLNNQAAISQDQIIDSFEYAHPVFDTKAIQAQNHQLKISGRSDNVFTGTYFCGAYWGFGFHEDGVNSSLRILDSIEETFPI